jgi:RNA polymerase sigma-B factor
VSSPLDEVTDRRAATRSRSHDLFLQLNNATEGTADRQSARDALVSLHLPLVEHLARRFAGRGEPLDDLIQVGTIGLIKSVDRFDSNRGVEFSTYATPTIIGEIKRYFRDKGWAIRVPRRLQELRLSLTTATEELSHALGRAPTLAEIGTRIGVSEEEVLEGLESANAYTTVSLDAGADSEDGPGAVLDTIGVDDEALDGVVYRESLRPLLAQLAPRERQILMLRFFRNMTQSQIADEVGISQMHVSRLLTKTLTELRAGLADLS